ncbi:MAG TPA: hypothetical protein HPQ00_12270, partial [Magnetococcales bacterium]|nr:hypothetical protein [Magnetococcales bacterium]
MAFITFTFFPRAWAEAARETEIPRVILSFFDSREQNGEAWFGPTHKFAEMPLNHLGLVVRYLDINQPLPDPTTLTDIRGVLLWSKTNSMDNPAPFIEWSIAVMKAGKRFVVMGLPPWHADRSGLQTPLHLTEKFWRMLGFGFRDQWVSFTHDLEIALLDPTVVGFERPLPKLLPGYLEILPGNPDITPHLLVRRGLAQKQENVLIATGPRGGFAASDYFLFSDQDPTEDHDFFQWIINPFEFFRFAFATDDLPKPDASTLSNRRIYYSHIDGDGLRNLTEVKPYNEKKMTAAEVILKEIIEGYPEFPVTVAPVVGDLDPQWYGSRQTMDIARRLLAPPQVEVGNHTLSHPLDWGFFENFDPTLEIPFLKNYPEQKDGSVSNRLLEVFGITKKKNTVSIDTSLWKQISVSVEDPTGRNPARKERHNNYKTPRAYAMKPFRLEDEIQGANRTLQQVIPPGKTVKLLQWSGNTLPFEKAVRMARLSGMENLNGGDSRFDSKFPSVAWVAPLGRTVGEEWQSYASASNENTYTSLWTEHFFGFQHLVHTIKNTESPRRLIPFNIYYHLYSGEKLASLNALKHNLDYARSQSLAPVAASFYSSIAAGTVRTKLFNISSGAVEIRDRGNLQTVRFDRATLKQVDFTRSMGIIGQRHYHGSLYVALDQNVTAPRIMIVPYTTPAKPPPSSQPYLVEG